ncbi:MAG: ankyrin repeat domain-containing protein [Chlamydiia bacterium]|nr:ankyrin repeat domain-containing protein [Chlamydiia bacterium]
MSWQVNNGPLEPVPQQMLTDLRSACGVNDPAADATTNVAQLALRGSRSGSDSSDGAVHSAGSSGNDSPPAVRGTPPAVQELTQQQMMQLLHQQQEQMQQIQQQNQMLMQQMAAQSANKPLPRAPATSSSSSSNPRLDAALARASQARAAALEQQARLAPLFASTPASAAASTSTPGAPATSEKQTYPILHDPSTIPPAERVTFDGRDYRIPGLVRQINGDEIEIRLSNNTTDRVNLRGLCTVEITEDRGFWTYEIHRLMRSPHMPYDTIVAIMDSFLPNDKINLVDGHYEPLLRVAAGARGPGYDKATKGIRKNDGQTEQTVVGYLLARKADPNLCQQKSPNDGNEYEPLTALHTASYRKDTLICEQLLRAGAKVDGLLPRGKTPLHCAADYGNVDVAKLLISWGANLEAQNQVGETPLFLAANSSQELVKLLVFGFKTKTYSLHDGQVISSRDEKFIQADVTTKIPAHNGCTPLDFIHWRNFDKAIVNKMKERGAKRSKGSSGGVMGTLKSAFGRK